MIMKGTGCAVAVFLGGALLLSGIPLLLIGVLSMYKGAFHAGTIVGGVLCYAGLQIARWGKNSQRSPPESQSIYKVPEQRRGYVT